MTFFGKTLCAVAIAVFSTATLASPLSESENQLLSPLDSQQVFSDTSVQNKSTKDLFDSAATDLSNTDSAFINEDTTDAGMLFSDQGFDNQSLIININE